MRIDDYASIPTRAARIARLRDASGAAERIVLRVEVHDTGTHLGRVAYDVPRRVLAMLGVRALGEPGDRRRGGAFVHCFFDEEALLGELGDAGLVVVDRRAGEWTLERGTTPDEQPEPFVLEVARVLRVVADVERRRRGDGPEATVREMRARGSRERRRGPVGRARLRRAIGWIDALMPGGENCLRRTLLELSLDAGAARETIVFGLDVGRTGHVAFAGREDRGFDVAYELGPD